MELSKSEGRGAGAAQGLEGFEDIVSVVVGVKGVASGLRRVTVLVVVGVLAVVGGLGSVLRWRLGVVGVNDAASALINS